LEKTVVLERTLLERWGIPFEGEQEGEGQPFRGWKG
jgi:hypothetical protein